MHTMNLLKIWLTKKIFLKNAFYVFCPKNETCKSRKLCVFIAVEYSYGGSFIQSLILKLRNVVI